MSEEGITGSALEVAAAWLMLDSTPPRTRDICRTELPETQA